MPQSEPTGAAALVINGLVVRERATGRIIIDGVSLTVGRGEAVGIVGESGSGKSLTCRSALGLLPQNLEIAGGTVEYDGIDLRQLSYRQWRSLRGIRIAAVFQDPGSYLNPSITVGHQLAEVLRVRVGLSRAAARERAIELFTSMGLHNPAYVARQYPFELSGGMLQRVLIAIAIATDPELLIADEATTAVDAIVQAEVLGLLESIRAERQLSLVVVSHDLAVIAQVCERVIVMRGGRVIESGATDQVLGQPSDDYTKRLIEHHERYGIERFLNVLPDR